VFEKLTTPEEIFSFKLGAALTMERTNLEMLAELEEKANRPELKQQFAHHADETREQIGNIEQAFAALGEDVDDSPCPAIEGLEKEAKSTIRKTDDQLLDAIVLSAAAETEHHEIAVYEGLITLARARGADKVVGLLQQNLEQEQHTLEEVKSATEKIAQQGLRATA
jgi:ferritin-like metal-binding protein YciE